MSLHVRIPGRLGIALSEDQKRVLGLYSPKHEQEAIYREIYHLAPQNENIPEHYMFPGRVERAPRHHHIRSAPAKQRTTICHRDKDAKTYKNHRPWRPLEQCWPEHRAVVEVQFRSSFSCSTGRLPRAYHVDRKWYDADTAKPLNKTIERWRTLPS